MKNHSFLIALLTGVLSLAVWNAAAQTPDVKVVEMVSVIASGNAKLPYEFNYGRSFVLSLNLKIPNSETVKKNLISSLAEKELLDKIVFDLFSSEKQPEFVQVKFGSRVPLDIAQSILRAFDETPDIKITVALEEDVRYGGTQRVYIGSLTQRPGKPVTQDRLKSLLNPRLSLDEFHNMIQDSE